MFVGKHIRMNNLHPFALDRLRDTSVIFQSKCPLWLSDLHQILSFFPNYPNIKFHENPFSGCRVVTCEQTDLAKLMRFCNFLLRTHQKALSGSCTERKTTVLHPPSRLHNVQNNLNGLSVNTNKQSRDIEMQYDKHDEETKNKIGK